LVESNAGGRRTTRTLRIRYQHVGPESPERLQRDGILLMVLALILGSPCGIGALALLVISVKQVSLPPAVVAILPLSVWIFFWYISLSRLVGGTLGRRRRRLHGIVVDRRIHTVWGESTDKPSPYWNIAVDDGTSDDIPGWEVPQEVCDDLSPGTVVEATVSRGGGYLYAIRRAE
jgi:hypothetical protein